MVHVAIIPITSDVSAGSDVTLPEPYPDIDTLVSAVAFKKVDIVHEACGATGAVYSSATTLGSPINGATLLSVVSETPSTGQVSKKDSRTITVGDAYSAGEFILIVYIAQNEYPGF